MSPFTPAGARLAAFATAALWLATLAAQDASPPRTRAFAGLAAAGIDRGLRDSDPPRPARSSGDLVLGRRAGGAQYLNGSVIVKFRAGTSPAAQQAMVASVDGRGAPELSYA